jgi:hypothetical protein
MNAATTFDLNLASLNRSHLIVLKGDACRLARGVKGVRVLSGRAWVSYKGKDIVLTRNQEMRFDARREWAVVSGVAQAAVVLEVLYQ